MFSKKNTKFYKNMTVTTLRKNFLFQTENISHRNFTSCGAVTPFKVQGITNADIGKYKHYIA